MSSDDCTDRFCTPKKVVNIKPPPNWVRRVRLGVPLWLPKAQREARAESVFQPNLANPRFGSLFIRFPPHGLEHWFMCVDGKGNDNLPLIYPFEGYLPESEATLGSQEAEELSLRLSRLEQRVLGWEAGPLDILRNL